MLPRQLTAMKCGQPCQVREPAQGQNKNRSLHAPYHSIWDLTINLSTAIFSDFAMADKATVILDLIPSE